jgi:hypothetical protein
MVTRSVAASDGPADGPDVHGDERCPSCDAPAAWQVSRRHRFSPFGSVLLAVLAFWSAVFAALLGFGFTLSLSLLALAVFVALLTRKAEVCESCGFVRPQER